MILADQVFSLLAAVLLLALFFTLLHFSSSVTYRSRIVSEQRAETLLRDVLSAGVATLTSRAHRAPTAPIAFLAPAIRCASMKAVACLSGSACRRSNRFPPGMSS